VKSENSLYGCVYIYEHTHIKIFTFHISTLAKKVHDRYPVFR